MKVLFDIMHPAHVHFFRNAIGVLQEQGHAVRITARDKDITLQLLDRFDLACEVISRQARSKAGLASELLGRDLRLLRIVRNWRPDVMTSIAGISTARVGFLTRTRNLIFYDTENATLSNLLSYPFATEVLTPDCYRRKVLGRHAKYAGYHELAYLHPSRFAPDPEVLRGAGVDPEEPYSVVRFVSWTALHDVRKGGGLSVVDKRRLVERLEEHGRVFITSEDILPDDLAHHRLPVAPDRIHDLMAFARLYVGESSTMASESAILGTPAVYIDAAGTSLTDELEERYGLCFNHRPSQVEEMIDQCVGLLKVDVKHSSDFKSRSNHLLRDKIDVTGLIVTKLTGGAVS